ncbi:hypothetical protein CIL05_00280 [Virgibacillus profundi]|uniref:Uncharacterized protein n=1 Tax=Virgibacillus profundi TaxID=2024555 RepID=A0A2A2IHW2_9BACI|nr:hypothetical protein CIL05_00280 [Virgibacillus profundi]PXY55315.1 hypothetical protein CIT14_00280 [Virgibacillus profundi]
MIKRLHLGGTGFGWGVCGFWLDDTWHSAGGAWVLVGGAQLSAGGARLSGGGAELRDIPEKLRDNLLLLRGNCSFPVYLSTLC